MENTLEFTGFGDLFVNPEAKDILTAMGITPDRRDELVHDIAQANMTFDHTEGAETAIDLLKSYDAAGVKPRTLGEFFAVAFVTGIAQKLRKERQQRMMRMIDGGPSAFMAGMLGEVLGRGPGNSPSDLFDTLTERLFENLTGKPRSKQEGPRRTNRSDYSVPPKE